MILEKLEAFEGLDAFRAVAYNVMSVCQIEIRLQFNFCAPDWNLDERFNNFDTVAKSNGYRWLSTTEKGSVKVKNAVFQINDFIKGWSYISNEQYSLWQRTFG